MSFDPMMPVWAVLLLLGPLAVLALVLLVKRRRQRLPWMRRLLIVLLLAVVALRPVTPQEDEVTERMNANVFFVVDRTGSMNAEDGPEGQTRLAAAQEDMREIMDAAAGSRFGIIGFDSTATRQLPLTTDAGAARAWVDTLTTEPTAYSQGSNIDRVLPALTSAIVEVQEEDPDSYVVVYLLTDGENTDGEATESFSPLASRIDAGAVLGYGTEAGGPMRAQGGDNNGEYITDSNGQQAVSHMDAANLQRISDQLGVPLMQRTGSEESLDSTLEDLDLRPVPREEGSPMPSYDDWYWIASIPMTLLFIWELGAMTYRLPRRRETASTLKGASR